MIYCKKVYLASRTTVVAFALCIQTIVPSVFRFLARLQKYEYICQIWRALKIALSSTQTNKTTSHQKKKMQLIEIPVYAFLWTYLQFALISSLQLYKSCWQQSLHHCVSRHFRDRPISHCKRGVTIRLWKWIENVSLSTCYRLQIWWGRCHVGNNSCLMESDKSQRCMTSRV